MLYYKIKTISTLKTPVDSVFFLCLIFSTTDNALKVLTLIISCKSKERGWGKMWWMQQDAGCWRNGSVG
jgi:hypothetical protein